MQKKNYNGMSREQNKIQPAPTYSLCADEKLAVMEALDHIYITRKYQEMGCCSVCKKISLKKCSGCSSFYCSSECQTFDWPKHRLVCTSQRDNLSDRGSSASSIRMRSSSSLKNINEGPFIISDRGSPFTALTNQFNKKSRSVITNNKTLGSIKIANKQYQNKDLQSKSSTLGLNETKDHKNTNTIDQRKSFSPKRLLNVKKTSPENKKSAVRDYKNKISSNSSQISDDKLLKSIENISGKRVSTDGKMPLSLAKLGKIEVIATYRESPDRYWVMTVNSLHKYEEIQSVLNKECKNYETICPKVGLVCGCTFADEWFRGKILTLTPELTVHFIDYGNVSNYDMKLFKKLPDDLVTLPGVAFQIEFEESTPRQYKTEDLESLKFTIEESGTTPDGIPRVKVIDGMYGGTEPLKLAKPPERKRSEQTTGQNGRSVMESISSNSNGMLFFIPGEGDIRYASIVPDNNKEANDSIEKVLNIDSSNLSTYRALQGDYVLVTDKEGNDQRGRVLFRVESMHYVYLIDCGNVILSKNVYPLPKDLKDLIELGVKITVEEIVSQEQMKQLETCFFTVKGEATAGKWPCTLKNPEQQIIAHVLLEKPSIKLNWKPKLTYFKSGATVEITSINSPNSFYVRSVDVGMEQKFLDMNMEMIQFAQKAKNFESPPMPGEFCCARFREDGCFYRAIINSVEKGKIWVWFVDFGDEQETDLKDIKPLPETLKNVPFFAVKVELKNVSSKPWNNMIKEYIGKLISDNVELTLTFLESLQNGVFLKEKVAGVIVNEFIEVARDKIPMSSPSLSTKEIFLDDDMIYSKFPSGSTFTLAILYVCEYEFKTGYTFWATIAQEENFNYVNVELSCLISEHCEKVSSPYEPSYRELCLAEFEGSWYRAICAGHSGDAYKVFFVDFGNCCDVKSTSIRRMEKEFLEAPALAINCTISGCERLKGNVELTEKISMKLIDRINTCIEGVKVTKFEYDTFMLEIPEIEAMFSRQ